MVEPLRSAGDKPPLGLIAGPTASGKSGYAVALARQVEAAGGRAVIINADSTQMYADLRVLSARPAEHEMGGIDHRLFGVWDGSMAGSAAEWAALANAVIAKAHSFGHSPILVGGTGLYLRTLLDGIAPIPSIPSELRDLVRAMPQDAARQALEQEDPDAASRLAPADRTRTQRALEVVRGTGRSIVEWHTMKEGGIADAVTLDARILIPPRDLLYTRCDARFSAMMQAGAIAEVEALLARKLDSALPVMRAIGVPEITAYLQGAATLEEATALSQTATRQYAKRQYTWFSRQPPSDWQRLSSTF